MTRTAVIGVGSMGRNHVRVYQEMPETDLVAIVDQDRVRAERVAQVYNIPVYTDLHQMVQKERPEAVSVAVPTRAHFPVAKALLESGCHVLVEKPITRTLAEAQALIQIAEAEGRKLVVGHIERFNPAVTELKRRLEVGELGRIFQIHARRLGPFPARIQDVGVVMDLATHDLDIMRYVVGNPVSRIFAETKREVHAHCEDLFIGVLCFEDTTLGLLEINWLTPTKIRKLYVTGERGMFQVNYITQDLCFFENAAASDGNWSTLDLLHGVSQGAEVHFPIQKKEPLRAELESFIAYVQGKEAQVVDAHEAAETLALAIQFTESAWKGGASEVIHDEINRHITSESLPGSITVSPTKVLAHQARA
jgi:predicted dehydrogenase